MTANKTPKYNKNNKQSFSYDDSYSVEVLSHRIDAVHDRIDNVNDHLTDQVNKSRIGLSNDIYRSHDDLAPKN